MSSPKSGKAGSAVTPIDPKVPYEADKADPGEMAKVKAEQKQRQSGKYGAPEEKPHTPPQTDEEREQKTSWIEIELVDEQGKPVPGEPFKMTLPDGSVFPGTLNEKGCYRLKGIDPGTCQITFPKLDKDAWEKA